MGNLFHYFGLKMEAKGGFKVKIRVLIPYLLYITKLELSDYLDSNERKLNAYILNITPFIGINFSYGKEVKRPD